MSVIFTFFVEIVKFIVSCRQSTVVNLGLRPSDKITVYLLTIDCGLTITIQQNKNHNESSSL